MKKQGVILAAGRSTRTIPLTLTRPKPLLSVAGKTLIEHNLDALMAVGIQEVALVVGYLQEQLKTYLEGLHLPINLYFVEQKEALGTAHALYQAKSLGKMEDFILLMGDDLYSKEDLKSLTEQPFSILGYEIDQANRFGVLEVEGGLLKGILEKPPHIQRAMANTGAYGLTGAIFDYLDVQASERGEMEFTEALSSLARQEKVHVVAGHQWIPLTYPWSLLDVNRLLLSQIEENSSEEMEVEPGAIIKGVVRVGARTTIKAGAYLEGPIWIGEDCTLGPHCHIRPYTTLGRGCQVGHGAEVGETVAFDGVEIGPLSYVAHSVIGEKAQLGAGTLVAHQWSGNGHIQTEVQGKVVDTGLKNLGAILGDGATVGQGAIIYPGCKVWPHLVVAPGERVVVDRRGEGGSG